MVTRPPSIPDRGEIWHLQFDPSTGREMIGNHFCLVLSKREFNEMGLALVCPISQGASNVARNQGFLVTLMGEGTDTQGNVHSHQVRTLDWKARQARFKEKAPDSVTHYVISLISAILE